MGFIVKKVEPKLEIDFQFPLWDSSVKELEIGRIVITFQFPLWDSIQNS